MTTLTSYLTGEWRRGNGKLRPLFNPATEEALAECGSDGLDFAAAVVHARDVGGPALRQVGFTARAGMLKALSKAIHDHREELIELSIRNGGNTRGDAKFDIDGATGTLAAYGAFGKELGERATLPDGEGVQLGRTPRFWGQHVLVPRLGVAVHVNAFNFPAWGMGEKMASALLAGVPVIEKPGTPSALLAWRIGQIVVESGILPEGAFQMIVGGAGDLLDHLGPQDCLSFTGSAATGARLRATPSLLRHNVRVNIEADSVNAAILSPDLAADSETYGLFLTNVVLDMTQKAGQKCTAVRRILVPTDRMDTAVEELTARLSAVKVGDPAASDTGMGPVMSKDQLTDVRAGIEALARTGRTACGGAGPVAPKGWFVAPTLVVSCEPRAAVIHEREVFGPVATVVPYSGAPEDAIALANLGGGGLVASVYGDDRGFLEQVATGIAPWHGRVWLASEKVASQTLPPGMVLPQLIHGGPGRAGGGEELGGLRGLGFYLQRTALAGDQALLGRAFGTAG
jgi:oxepin-CoA hydrolase/3-oxo-5,6-dehydrosuberyl-CoA semialdehyde dehydrogenase